MNPPAAVRSSTAMTAMAALLVAAVSSRISAQQPRRVVVGDRIRIEATTAVGGVFGPTVGSFEGATGDTIWIRRGGHVGSGVYRYTVTAIDRRSVRTLEVSIGHRHARTGAIVGAVAFATMGGLLSIAWDVGCTHCSVSVWQAGLVAALAAVPGAGVGALVGLPIRGTGPWVPGEIPRTASDQDTATASSP